MHRFKLVLIMFIGLAGCIGEGWGSSGSGGSIGFQPGPQSYGSPPPTLAQCEPTQEQWNRIDRLYVETENSIHELITCGQVQVRLSKSMLAIVLASNKDLFRGDAFERLAGYARTFGLDLEAPFSRGEGGKWVMPIPTAGEGSQFWVQFFKPGCADPILADPFDLASYVTGVYVETSITLDEMWDDFDRQNVFTFRWEEEGPLVGLLNGGEPLPNPFIVRASIADIASLVIPWFASGEDAEFGALVSLTDAQMISCVELRDQRGPIEIEYRADGRKDTIANIAGGEGVSFDVKDIEATDGTYELLGDAEDLRFLGVKNLAGEIHYKISGPEADVRVTSDFGDGNAWPAVRWMCPEDGPEPEACEE